MGRLFDIVEQYRDRYAPHEPTYSKIAAQVGVSRQTLLNWQAPTKLIAKEHLIALADVTGVPYEAILDALIEDIGYKRPGDVVPMSERRRRVAGDELASELEGLPSVAHKPRAKGRNND